jgi:hypothetical protein
MAVSSNTAIYFPDWKMRVGETEEVLGNETWVENIEGGHEIQFLVPYNFVAFYKLSDPEPFVQLMIGVMRRNKINEIQRHRAGLNTQCHIPSYAAFQCELLPLRSEEYWYKVEWHASALVSNLREVVLQRESDWARIKFY